MRPVLFIVGVVLAAVVLAPASRVPEREISLDALRDKIEGGWAGQMIGVSYGAPTEFRYRSELIPEGMLPSWTPDRISNALGQDDLYVDMTFAKVLDDHGLDATSEQFGAAFKEAKYPLWHANLAARRALRRGVPASQAGLPRFNVHANDIDFQIEADFIGMMTPGLPQASNEIAWRAGRVMNHGDGIYGGMFVSCMYAEAFFESDPRKLVEAGVACLPAGSPYALMMNDVLAWSKAAPSDWITVWNRIEEKWNRREPCPSGALRPYNIDAKINGAYIALGLIYGAGDIGKTVTISTRCGQDSDCNPSSAAGIVGVMRGMSAIPNEWTAGIAAIADKKFDYTDFSFRSIVESNLKRTLAMVQRSGGRVEGNRVIVKRQAPRAAQLLLWDDYGSPVERIAVDNARWAFKGSWTAGSQLGRNAGASRTSAEAGAEATIAFAGTGAVLAGAYLPDGGTADVYLDGKFDRTVDVYPDEDQPKFGEAVWHRFGLRAGRHTLRLVVRGEPYAGSKGAKIALSDLIIFR